MALDPLLYEGDIREKSISILENVLNTNWSIQYNRDYYTDRDLKANESIYLNLTIIPFGETKSPNLKK